MKCQKCNKNEATVQYKESINGTAREICLCSDCAKETGLLNRASGIFENMQREMMSAFAFPFGGRSLLGGFGSGFGTAFENAFESPFTSFPEIGGFFETDPVESLETIDAPAKDNKKTHKEKRAEKRAEKKAEKKAHAETEDELKAKLLDAIADERYEDAAKLRDKIKKIKGE